MLKKKSLSIAMQAVKAKNRKLGGEYITGSIFLSVFAIFFPPIFIVSIPNL